MSKENAHLLKQGVDGAYKPFLHNGKHIVENVDLVRVSPDYVGAVSNVALMANMAAIAAKLEAIEVGVRNIARLMADTQRGRVKGALDALALAQALADLAERRTQMISAGRHVVIELGALAGQLRAHIAAMPKETTGLLDGFYGRSTMRTAITSLDNAKPLRDPRYGTVFELAGAFSGITDLGFAFVEVNVGATSPAHFHNKMTELYHVVEGSGIITLDGAEIAVSPGHCISIRPGVVHSIKNSGSDPLRFFCATSPAYSEDDDHEV